MSGFFMDPLWFLQQGGVFQPKETVHINFLEGKDRPDLEVIPILNETYEEIQEQEDSVTLIGSLKDSEKNPYQVVTLPSLEKYTYQRELKRLDKDSAQYQVIDLGLAQTEEENEKAGAGAGKAPRIGVLIPHSGSAGASSAPTISGVSCKTGSGKLPAWSELTTIIPVPVTGDYHPATFEVSSAMGHQQSLLWDRTYPNTATYVLTRDGKGRFFVGLVRKLGPGVFRKPFKAPVSRVEGAAGTDKKYWGKWTNVGGGGNLKFSALARAIHELNEEACVEYYRPVPNRRSYNSKREVDLGVEAPLDIGRGTMMSHLPITVAHVEPVNGKTLLFILEMEPRDFFALFPSYPACNVGWELVKSSKGEIDATQSLTLDQMQQRAHQQRVFDGNNYFPQYFINTWNNYVVPKYLRRVSKTIRDQMDHEGRILTLPSCPDTKPRQLWKGEPGKGADYSKR